MSGADKEGKNETESGSAGRHVVKGEFRHKGILYCDYFPLEDLEKIPDVQYKADDVILATYPKCGRNPNNIYYTLLILYFDCTIRSMLKLTTVNFANGLRLSSNNHYLK